jgi:SHS2 domain-containing protein
MNGSSEIEHTADRAFTVWGENVRELFQHAAEALFGAQGVMQRGASVDREIHSSGVDRETLLVNWLNEILYLQEIHGETYDGCKVLELSEHELRARLFGCVGAGRRPIKAVTFHNLRVDENENGLRATLVVDV